MDFLQSSFGNKQSQDELNKYLMYLKKQKDSKLPALQDNQNIDPNLDIMLNRDITSPDYRKVPIEFPQTPSTVKETPKSNALTDRQKFAKTLGISEQTLNSLDANTTDLSKGIDALTAGKDLSAFMNVNAPSKTIKAGTPPTDAQAIAPAGTTTTGQPTKSQDIATRTTAPAGTESPKPQEDEFGNRMAATAVGNILGSLGAGLAGYSPTSVNQMFQGLYGQLMQRQKEKEERDPNSVVSKNYRDMIQPYIPKGINLEGKSAFDLKQTVPYMISQAEREADRQFKAGESAKDRASMERRFKDAYGYKVDERQKKREDKVFGELTKGAQEIYDVNEARGLLKDIQEMKSIISKRSPASLTAGRARGIFGIGGDPFGFEDVDIKRLETIKTGLINKLVKDSGESGALSQADKQGFEKGFVAVNSGNLNAYLTAIENRIEQTRQNRMDKFNKKIQSANKQYNTNYNVGDFIDSFDATPEVEQKANGIPKFELKL